MVVRGVAALVLAVGLAGCVAEEGGGIRSVALLDGQITATAPAGYCIAPGAGRRDADSAVILMGPCRAGGATVPALVTVTVGPGASAGAIAGGGEALAAFFASEAGRATLSRSGRGRDVVVLEAKAQGDVFLLRLRDRIAGDYWRAISGLRGRLVSVTADGPGGETLDPAAGKTLVLAAMAAMARANAGKGPTNGVATGG